MGEQVLVDTSVWIDYFRGDAGAIRQLDSLIDQDRVLICGLVRQEVLQGTRDSASFERLLDEMSIWDYEEERPEDFVEAARVFAELRWRGVTIPPSDCLVAAVALRRKVAVFARDSHFEAIPSLRRLRIDLDKV